MKYKKEREIQTKCQSVIEKDDGFFEESILKSKIVPIIPYYRLEMASRDAEFAEREKTTLFQTTGRRVLFVY